MIARWAFLVALAGCGGGQTVAPPPPASCFAGDPMSAPAVTLVYQTAGSGLAPVADGSTVPLVVPPQGGEVLVVGVRALNIDG
ncbi:MAG: hypothetical protein ACJ8F1_11665, partial [Polyangia bacterium]